MTELETLFQYLSLAIMLFFITFFVDIFYQYVRYKNITPRKMLTFRRGGLFEHYKIVGAIILVLFVIHGVFDVSPFVDSLLAFVLDIIINYIFVTIFLVFFFVFITFLVLYGYARIKKIEDRAKFLNDRTVPIINASMIVAAITAAVLILVLLLNLPT